MIEKNVSDNFLKDNSADDNNPINLDDFTGLLIHSYNNYLSSMMGYAELALLECNDDNAGERLNKSLESGISAVHFGKSILASIGRLQIDSSPVKFKSWLSSFIQTMQSDFDENELFIENFVRDDVRIMVDEFWFTECCADLIRFLLAFDENSDLTFTAELHRYDTQSSKNDGQLTEKVVICIYSENIELDDKQSEWLFTPFYSSRLLLGDKDIGLAKVKGFLEQSGASIEWDNDSGFNIEFPVLLKSQL